MTKHFAASFILCAAVAAHGAELNKTDRLLQQNGLLIAGNANPDADFDPARMQAAHYNMVLWQWASNLKRQANMPWGRWAGKPADMPPLGAEAQAMGKLWWLQISDEPALRNPATLKSTVEWMQAAEANPIFRNTILSTDLSGIDDATINNFISAAHPDLLTFDLYPYTSEYVPAKGKTPSHAGAPQAGPPSNWYGELRRFRADTINTNTRFGIYRQTFHSIEDYDTRAYRDPTPSELGLNTFGALAFNAKALADFEVNTGATSLFAKGRMADPAPLYGRMRQVNKAAQAFGQALVRLTPLNDVQNGADYTTDILFIRGQYKDSAGAAQYNRAPIGFRASGGDEKSYFTQWRSYATAVAQGNPDLAEDPWLTGFQAKNLGKTNDGLKGDAIIAWFKPIGIKKADALASKDVYFMVVNALTSADPDSTAADCEQFINLDFSQAPIHSIEYIDPVTGSLKTLEETSGPVPAAAPGGTCSITSSGGKLHVNLFLNGGDAFLFKFNIGDPFVSRK